MIRCWILAAMVVSSLACAIRVERAGNQQLRDPHFDWGTGETTAEQVARELGPPDEIRSEGEALDFVYRFERRRHSRFVLSYFLKLLTRDSDGLEVRVLVVSFDRGSRLLGYRILAPLRATRLGGEGRARR